MSNRSDVAWSCVLDNTPHIWASVVPRLATATGLAQIAPSQIYVHHVCMLPPRMAELCEALKVHTRKIEPFDHRYPHTNKIRQCATTFSELRRVVLTDVDVVFTGVLPIDEIQEPVAGKLVDGPNPPMRNPGKNILDVWRPSAKDLHQGLCKSGKHQSGISYITWEL